MSAHVPTVFPWRQIWRWFNAPRLSWAQFVIITVIAALVRVLWAECT